MSKKKLSLDDVIANPFQFPLEKWIEHPSSLRWHTEDRLVMPGETMKISDFLLSCYDYRNYDGFDQIKANEDKINYLCSLISNLDLNSRLSIAKVFINVVIYESAYVTEKILNPTLLEIKRQSNVVNVCVKNEIFLSSALDELKKPNNSKISNIDRALAVLKGCNLSLNLGLNLDFEDYCNSAMLKDNLIWSLLASLKYVKAISNNEEFLKYEKFVDDCKDNFTFLILEKFNNGYKFNNVNLAVNELILSNQPIEETLDRLDPLIKSALESEGFKKKEANFLFKILNNIDFYFNFKDIDKKILLPYFDGYEKSLKKNFFIDEKVNENEVELKVNFVKLLRVVMLSALNIDCFSVSRDNKQNFLLKIDENTNINSTAGVTLETFLSNNIFKNFFKSFENEKIASWSVQEDKDSKELQKNFIIKVKKEDVDFVKDLFLSYFFVPKEVQAYESHEHYNLVKIENYIMTKQSQPNIKNKQKTRKF